MHDRRLRSYSQLFAPAFSASPLVVSSLLEDSEAHAPEERHRHWWCRSPGMFVQRSAVGGWQHGLPGIHPRIKIKLLPAEPQGTCGTSPPAAWQRHLSQPPRLLLPHRVPDVLQPQEARERKQEAGNQRLEAAGEHARRRRDCNDALPKIALDVSSARMDRDWVQNEADSCHRLQRTSGEPREHTSRWLSHH